MAVIPTTGNIFRDRLQVMIHFLELGIVIRVSERCHDPEKFLRANHQFYPVRSSLAERFHGFVTYRYVIGTFVGKHDAIQQGNWVMVVRFVESFQRDFCPATGAIFQTGHVVVCSDILQPVLFVHQVSLLVGISHRGVRGKLIIASGICINKPFGGE